MAGTRGGVGRIVAMAIGLAVVLALVLADAARAGTYRVVQCGWGVGAELDPALPPAGGQGFFLRPEFCAPPAGVEPPAMRFEAAAGIDGSPGVARALWVAPPGTTLTEARATWDGHLQPGFWQALGAYVGGEFHGLAGAIGETTLRPVAVDITGPASAFEARLECPPATAFGCSRARPSTMLLGGLTFTIDDPLAPLVGDGGALLDPGWHRGAASLYIGAEDVGAGVAQQEVRVDGAPLAVVGSPCSVLTIEGEVRGTQMRPCPATATRTLEVDTTRIPDGSHTLHYCATDFAGDLGCVPDAQVEVDNSPPAIAFAGTKEGKVAATVSDPFSGPGSGTISVRRADSDGWTDLPTSFGAGGTGKATLTADLPDLSEGSYVFRASAADAAGNGGTAELRVSGTAAEIRESVAGGGQGGPDAPSGGQGGEGGKGGQGGRPGGRGVHGARGGTGGGRATHLTAYLTGHGSGGGGSAGRALTLDYGSGAVLHGRLTGADGAGLGGRHVTVVARAARGAGIPRAVRRLVTDRRGRFRLGLPAGASRQLVVAFHGSDGLAPSHARPPALRVRAAVTLAARPTKLSTGESVLLSGQVRRGPARIPRRGKVVAIQYLERGGGWRPALVVRTDARGRFRVRYRFRYITGTARIRLRASALPEAGWPYAAGSSHPVTVAVDGS
jgi:hypothetical protein